MIMYLSSFRKLPGSCPESKSNNAFLQTALTGLWLTIIIFPVLASPAYADECPTPKEIREREISRRYDWAVPENVSLEQLLSVEKLYSVRIIDTDKYISCRYTTAKWPVSLDGEPLTRKCTVTPDAGEWASTESDELVCQEEDVTKCGFKLECK